VALILVPFGKGGRAAGFPPGAVSPLPGHPGKNALDLPENGM
jgi:hypothetical protein